MGLNPAPEAVYRLQDRFCCNQCSKPPEIVKVDGKGTMFITVRCHGQEHTGCYEMVGAQDANGYLPKNSLRFTQYVF
jgi:hypothetical protein